MSDNLMNRWPADMSWVDFVALARLGSFERAMLFATSRSLGEKCSCVGSIRKLPRDQWKSLPWMDRRTHDNTVDNIIRAATEQVE